ELAERAHGESEKYRLSPDTFEEICQHFNARGPYRATPADIAAFNSYGDATVRKIVAERGLGLLRELYQEGIQENSPPSAQNGITVLHLRRPDGEITESRVQNLENALTYLRVSLNIDPADRNASHALFRLLRNG